MVFSFRGAPPPEPPARASPLDPAGAAPRAPYVPQLELFSTYNENCTKLSRILCVKIGKHFWYLRLVDFQLYNN